MKGISSGQLLTVLANLGVIAGLALLIYELRQAHDLAEAEIFQTVVANEIAMSNAITANADIWEKGNAGDLLDSGETEIYGQLLSALSAKFYFKTHTWRELGLEGPERIEHAELALFLHRNPGALEKYREYVDDLSTYRDIIDSSGQYRDEYGADWSARMTSALAEFERFDAGLEN